MHVCAAFWVPEGEEGSSSEGEGEEGEGDGADQPGSSGGDDFDDADMEAGPMGSEGKEERQSATSTCPPPPRSVEYL